MSTNTMIDTHLLHRQMIPSDNHERGMLVPMEWQGPAANIPKTFDYHWWIKDIPGQVFCYLWALTPSGTNEILPKGYDAYVVSFHLEAIDWSWIEEQARQVDAPIILLSDGNYYDWPVPKNVFCETWLHWHRQVDQIKTWFPARRPRESRYKASAMCNRISQSKLLIATALLEYHDRADVLVRLNTWFEPKNVHFWAPNNMPELDQLTEIFRQKYFGQVIRIDDFVSGRDNYHKITADPWADHLSCVGVHFTNESFHYSLMCQDDKCHTMPGPFLTEKTMRCLGGDTPFVPVGQFDTYGSLSRLGLNFDYDFDTSWDQDPGNLSRLQSIIDLIKQWRSCSAQDISDMTKQATQHNYDMIWSGEFFRRCELRNDQTKNRVVQWLAQA